MQIGRVFLKLLLFNNILWQEYLDLIIYSSVEEQLNCFWNFAIMNKPSLKGPHRDFRGHMFSLCRAVPSSNNSGSYKSECLTP